MSTHRYFHGTTAVLSVGDILVPGNRIDVFYHGRSEHVYASTTGFAGEHVFDSDAEDTEDNRLSMAVDCAQQWGLHAADYGGCTDRACAQMAADLEEEDFHYQCHNEGMLRSCVHVYEVEPLSVVESDGTSDIGSLGVRMVSARVIAVVTDKPLFT